MRRCILLSISALMCLFTFFTATPFSTNAARAAAPGMIVHHTAAAPTSAPATRPTGTAANPQGKSPHNPVLFPSVPELSKLPGSKPIGQVQGSGDLIYHGGPVEETPRVFLIFWGPTWNNGHGGITPDGQIVENYFNDLNITAFEDILTQYYDTNVPIPNTLTVGGTYLDFAAPPTDNTCGGSTVEDASIQNEVNHAISVNHWPRDVDSTYFVYTPSNEYVNDGFGNCSEIVFCGYHGFSPAASVPYAALPYPFNMTACPALAMPNGNAAGDSLTNISSHEQFESISDPQLSAWYDSAIPAFEIGDKCAFDFSAGLTNLNNGGTFAVQTEYSNASHSCVNTFTPQSAFQMNPTALNVVVAPGTNPSPQQVTLRNPSSATLNWTAGTLPSWVSVSQTSGSLAPRTAQPLTFTFNITGSTPQTLTTTLTFTDTNASNSPFSLPITVVATSASKTWYFAEGYTGGGFSEFLTLANPNSVTANVQVTYLLGSGIPINKNYMVAATSRFTIKVNNEVGPNQNVSMVVSSDQPVIAERPMYFTFTGLSGFTIPGGTDVLGATSLSTNFDFGYLDTTSGHATFLTILNQNTVTMNVTIQYFAATGGAPTTTTHMVPPNSRGTVAVNGEGLAPGTYSALVTLDQPGLVERPLYLKDSTTGYTGSADVVGVPNPQTDWFFAEGFIASTFSERYILSNPSTSVTAHATVTFFLSNGLTPSIPVTLAPGQQQIVTASTLLGTNNVNNSAHVSADAPILAERFISFKYTGQVGGSGSSSIQGASDVLGATSLGSLFYFAEGFTGSQFAEYLTLENPDPLNTAFVTVTFLPANGAVPTVKVYLVAPSTRFTVFTNNVLSGQSFSMVVASNRPIVAERPMYFNFPGGQTGGSDVVGYQAPGSLLPAPPAAPPTLYIGSTDGNEYALDPGTGQKIWSATIGEVISGAALGDGAVYVATNFGGDDLVALNAHTGSVIWSFSTGTPNQSTPLLVNQVLYFEAGNGIIYAFNAITGTVMWQFQTGGPNAIQSSSTPALANGMLYIGATDGNVYALNANTGTKVWSFTTSGGVYSSPAVVNGVVYIGSSDHNVYALNASNGTKVWSFTTGNSVNFSPAVANGVVYIGSADNNVYALNANTGTQIWSFATGDSVNSSPAVVNGVVYISSSTLVLYALDASNGSKLWSFPSGGTSPLVSNGIVYVGSVFSVYAVNASSGTQIWSFMTQANVYATPAIG